MKLRIATLLLLFTLSLPGQAAVRHKGVSLHTYVNMATNAGRYVTNQPNAILQYLRQRDGGIRIPYTTGQAAYTLPHGVPDFSAVADMGNATAVAYNYIATVAHNSSRLYPTFTAHDAGLGAQHTRRYIAIEEQGNDKAFVHQIFSGMNDFKLSRLCRLATDTIPATMTVGWDFKGQLIYRVGGGLQQLRDIDGKNTDESIQDVYTVAGIAAITNWQRSGSDMRVYNGTVIGTTSWGADGIGLGTPLPFGSTPGDSGSPYFVWQDGQFRFLMAHHGSTNGNRQTVGCEATDWALSTMAADCVSVDMSKVQGSLILDGAKPADDKGGVKEIINGQQIVVSPARGYLRDAKGNMYDTAGNALAFRAVAQGEHTWKSLTDRRDLDNWYAYGSEYLNAGESVVIENKEAVINKGLTFAQLFLTQNLVLHSAKTGAKYSIEVAEDTDLGAGYIHFAAEKLSDVSYHIRSTGNAQLDTAGFIVDAGVTAAVSLRNPDAAATREWRKVGKGTLHLCGFGNNEVLLNVGGSGLTLLEQKKGYAAYNVLVNTGSTVRIANPQQIARDLTIGAGGGTLDVNGNSMDWYTTSDEKRPGFSIRALTEQATIANSTGHATLTYREKGEQHYPGSFRDTDSSSLNIIYAGGSNWKLSGCHTALLHPKSLLTVQNGSVTLTGTPTVHGYGTVHTRDTADFTTRPNDWHYADASMNVTVRNGSTFELGSHARLRGNVTVESGGTYTMSEGVQHSSEFVEGGESPENTAALADFYGHKGDVTLNQNATLRLTSSPETDTTTHYSGKISGQGNVLVESASEKAAFHLSEALKSLHIVIRSGRLILSDSVTSSHISIQPGASLSLQHNKQELLTLRSREQKAELFFTNIKQNSPTEVTMGDFGAAVNPRIRHTHLQLASGSTLNLLNTSIRPDSCISAEGATLNLIGTDITIKGDAKQQETTTHQNKQVPLLTFPCHSLQGKLTITGNLLITLPDNLASQQNTLVRVQFAPGIRISTDKIRATLKHRSKAKFIQGFMLPGEENAVYFHISARNKTR
ncbi:MAG: hypothetical protein II295_02940 [Akkermansia sp.]|nr:hypothetical protein [Akkermansia sp.]